MYICAYRVLNCLDAALHYSGAYTYVKAIICSIAVCQS